ncbi:MAG: protein kinase, partial [Verrucomicrobiales bacterium]|nr:protein kinase [Verrucomicrobiales bacterium]
MPSEKTRKQLQQEIRELNSKIVRLQEIRESNGDGSGAHSIVGVRTLTLRYDADSKQILRVNTPFANYVRMQKEELVGQTIKVLASVLGGDIYKEISTHDSKVVTPPRISDAANNVYEVLTTEHDGVVDVVMRDMTEAQQFRSYVQRYFGLDFESLSDEDKRSLSFPERRFITISFTDLRGFTRFTESNNPEEVRNAINAYFDEVIEAAEENDVFPNQIVGDEVMVLYGAPKYHRDHPLRAVKTACEHIERVTRLRAEYARHGKEIPHCGIGINSGDVIVGDMGSSVRDRKTYTALGTAVNLAARLCSAATPGQIILSEATLNAVLRVLPDGWEHREVVSKNSSSIFDPSSDKPQGKIEDVIPLPASLRGKEVYIGPGAAAGDEEAEFVFRYLFQIKAKGIAEALPVLTVERPKKTAMSQAALSDETEANEDGEMILGRYRLVAHIGRGGMGTVWRARDEFVNTVAIKMLNAGHGASESQVARFKREAKVMGKLAHRNICRIHEIGKAEGRIFIAMQFIDGVSLEQLISHQSIVSAASVSGVPSRQHSAVNEGSDFSSIIDSVKSAEAARSPGPEGNREDGKVPDEAQELIDKKTADIGTMVMTDQQILTIISKVCDAVQFAHERGVLHRDLKPANIMIGRDGEPIVMDFGLAKLTRQRDDEDEEKSLSISLEGQVVGTIEYMAPEQALSSKEVNEQADVYSIGAILYHLLTGQKPFRSSGHILADAKALQDHEPVAPRKLDRLIDPDLETIILKTLQPDRAQRYRSVMQVRQDIEKYQSGDPISARKPTLLYRFNRKYRKNRVTYRLGALALILGVALLVYYIWDYQKNWGDWNEVDSIVFSGDNPDSHPFMALDQKGELAERLWVVPENGNGVRLPQNQWLWYIEKEIRGDAKVKV